MRSERHGLTFRERSMANGVFWAMRSERHGLIFRARSMANGGC
jgi:hypothetical protein